MTPVAALGRGILQALSPVLVAPSGLRAHRQQRLWRDSFTHIAALYSSSSVASLAGSTGAQQPLPDHERSGSRQIEVMSSRDFHRRVTRSSAASSDPNAGASAPAPHGFIPQPVRQYQPGQHFPPGNQGPVNFGYGTGAAPMGMLGNYPVSHQQPQHFNSIPANGHSSTARSGHQAHPTHQSAGVAEDFEDGSDASSDASVGGPLPRLTPEQERTVTIPILGQPSKKKAAAKVKDKKRPYQRPSKASGGVPNPTKAYIAQSALAPSRMPQPRRILVIIDLNGTLLHRPSHKRTKTFVERPFTRSFLDYCLKTFTVAIWSSAKPQNVLGMVPQILSPQEQRKLVAIWGRDTLGLSEEDYSQRVQCYKRLESIWNDPGVMASHPEAHAGKRWDQTNTVLIDDSKEKARSQPYNIIQIPEFEGDASEFGYVLPQVHDYLNQCAYQRDISSFIRENPFKYDMNFSLGVSQA